ncbi:PqqD family peptide modification chaperone [Plantactinospora sp. WMMB782]|uniref:PqqD family peptide modification chaperone n=1 Tax=Plantactinospora sp. WMMB782 TaxID=3404121 RepID=UPI003B93F014
MRLSKMWGSLVVPDDLGYFRCRDRYLVENRRLAAWTVLSEDELRLLRALADGAAPPYPSTGPDRRTERVLAALVLNWLVYLPDQVPRVRAAEPVLRTVRYAVTGGCGPSGHDGGAAACAHPLPDELEPAEALDLVDQIAELGAELLILTGGEPMLRPDLFELADRARDRGLRVDLVTSGSRIRDAGTARRIADTFAGVTVSLDGDRHQVPGPVAGEDALARTVRGLTLLNAAGVKPAIDHVVSPENIAALDDLMALLDGIEFSRVRMMSRTAVGGGSPTGPPLGWDHHPGGEPPPGVRRSGWTRPVARKILTQGPVRPYPVRVDREPGGIDLHVDPRGDVYPRESAAGPAHRVGNLRSRSLREMFAPPAVADGMPDGGEPDDVPTHDDVGEHRNRARPEPARQRPPTTSTADNLGRCHVTLGINTGIVWVDDDAEVRLYNPDDGQFQTFNASAARIWRRLVAGTDLPTVVRELTDAFGGVDGRERELVARDVREFVGLLRARDLLRPAGPAAAAGESGAGEESHG